MVFQVHRLTVKKREANTFLPRFKELAAQLEEIPGFDHYRLIPRNEFGNAYTLLTFWLTEEDAKMSKLLYFFQN